ncbi:MAG: SGNH/GDSL hydrolase family protein [Candidatus Aminicenantes bacterium]|nr:SGNH/GDSL hydrolase family protein [Candidatus Aminicenantes bacterium]
MRVVCSSSADLKKRVELKIGLAGWIFLFTAALAFSQSEIGEPIPFKTGGRDYQVTVRAVVGGSAVFLQGGGSEKMLSQGGGEDFFPVVKTLEDRFFVLWVHHQPGMMGFGLYDSRVDAGRVVFLSGFSFLSTPTLVLQGREPRGMIFLGNSSGNDDIFFLDLWDVDLVNLSRTRVSEKRFSVESDAGGILVSALTLQEHVVYHLDLQTLSVSVRERRPRSPEAGAGSRIEGTLQTDPYILENTYIAFGDSITWGKMRMNGLDGEYHPELAYPEKMRSLLASSYGPAYPVNLGVPGETTTDGALRIDKDLEANPGLYFLLMMGTNDCISNTLSIDSAMENIEYIISKAEAKAMRVIISTIPPRKDALGAFRFVQNNIAGLNAGIVEMSVRRKIGFVDTHLAFMEYVPPDGWKSLLEDVVGNHPSPAGQLVIATLFSDSLAAFPPGLPSGIKQIPMLKSNQKAFQWMPCRESDFSYFRVEYGYAADKMVFTATTRNTIFFFTVLPYQLSIRLWVPLKIFYRIQAVDKGGHAGPFLRFQSS